MSNKFLQNNPRKGTTVKTELVKAIGHAQAVDIAVSYIQMSGWTILQRHLSRIAPTNIRLVTTDQMNVTQPTVLDAALTAGIQVKCYRGDRVYHPKVYVIHGTTRARDAVILGSANISGSALEKGIEAGTRISDRQFYTKTARWFDTLFRNPDSKNIDHAFVESYRTRWTKAAKTRAHIYHRTRPAGVIVTTPTPEDIDTLDDAFSTITLPVGTLGFDQAGNNIRNLLRVREVLGRCPDINEKEKSELHLLGFMTRGELTPLGRGARRARALGTIAREWCLWIGTTDETRLRTVNPRLVSFRRAATRFWRLRPEVREFFFEELGNPNERTTLQAMELCCNGAEVVETFTIRDFRSLRRVLMTGRGLSEFIGVAIDNYRSNKGSRSWTSDDRKTVLQAWRSCSPRKH